MTAECLGGDWYEPKDQIDHSQGKRVARVTREETTHKEESHNWKMFQWVKDFVHHLNSLFPLLFFQKVIVSS